MTITSTLRRLAYGGIVALALAPAAATAQTATVDEAARAALPEAVRDGGTLNVATSLQWAPFAYVSEDNEPVGIDVSLMKILAGKFGLELNLDNVKFPTIIPGVSSGRYQVGVNQLSMTPERLSAVDMVPYFETTSVVLLKKGKTVEDVSNLCGMTFVVTQGSVQVGQLEQLSAACVEKGAEPITQQLYPSSAETLLAVANGRGDAFLTARPQAAYITTVNDAVEFNPEDVPNVTRFPAGIVIEKGNAEMRKAVALALLSAIEDGSYQALLDDYDVGTGAISADTVREYAQ